MPTINITGGSGRGRPPGSTPGPNSTLRPGPTSQVPFMRPDYDAAWNSNKPGQTAPDDYARALAQKEAQQRRADADARRQRSDHDRAYADRDRQAKAAQRDDERRLKEEIRLRAADRRQQEQTRRHRQAEDDRHAKFRRSQDIADARVIDSIRDREHRQQTSGVTRLGVTGQAAAESRSWTGLARIEHELRRIERVNTNILKQDQKSTTEEKAAARRMLDAVTSARGRIATGRGGNSAVENAIGGGIGAAGLLMSNPYVKGGVAAATAAVGGPFLLSGAADAAASLSEPYWQFRSGSAALGRAGGFDSRDLESRFLPRSGAAPAWMKTLGVTPQSALGILGTYGIAPRSEAESSQLVADTRRASLSPMMSLSDQALARSAGLARTLGIANPGMPTSGASYAIGGNGALVPDRGQTQTNAYFATLQKVMTAATTQGLDHAQSLKTVEGLLRSSAGAGAATVNTGALSGFWGRMTSSGLPSMRSGEGVTSALSGINQSFSKIGVGGEAGQNTMMMSYFGRHGGMPKTEAALQKFLGMSGKDWSAMMANPGQKYMVQNYLNAAGKNPAFALTYLQPFLKGRPDLMKNIFEGSAFGHTNSLIKPLLGAKLTGAGYEGYIGMMTGSALPNAPGAAPIGSADTNAAIKAAAAATGMDPSLLKGLAAKESGLRPEAMNGNAAGLFQLMPAAQREMGLSRTDAFDPSKNAMAGANYLKKMFGLFDTNDPNRTIHALEAYEWGPGHAADIKAGRVPAEYVAHAQRAMQYGSQYANVPSAQYAAQANTAQIATRASRYAAEGAGNGLGGGVGDAMVSFSSSLSGGTLAVEKFTQALTGSAAAIVSHGAHAGHPGYSPMPPAASHHTPPARP